MGDDYNTDSAPMVLEKYGNVASAGSLIAFHETKDDFHSGELGVICSFGAGYSICSLVVEAV
jgi:beta-ketodecanoyl-[acyl-carrier-protein] synthase